MRFSNSPTLCKLYTYWSEPSQNPYIFKSLILLFEEGVLGNMLNSIVINPVRPTNRLVLKWFCDICKALIVFHNNNLVHASVKPSSIYLREDNTAILGEMGKVELDAARLSS